MTRLPLFTPSGAARALPEGAPASPLFSSSNAHRAFECAASAIEPLHAADPGDPEARDAGTVAHRCLARIPDVGPEAALAEVPEGLGGRETCENAVRHLDALGVDWAHARAEVPYAFDVEWLMARELVRADGGPIAERAYGEADPPVQPYEIAGTLDLLECPPGGAWRVSDYKTGRAKGWHRTQLRVLGLMVARANGLDGLFLRVIYLPQDGPPHLVEWYEDAAALAETEARVVAAAERVDAARRAYAATSDYDPTPGSHCEYCAVRPRCKVSAFALVATRHTPSAAIYEALRTPDGLAHWLDFYAAAKPALEALGAMLDEAVDALGPTVLPGGRVVDFVTETRRSVADEQAAIDVLSEAFGAEAAQGAVKVKRTVTLRAIEKVAQAHAERGGKGDAAERVLAEIERRGGIVARTHRRLEVKP